MPRFSKLYPLVAITWAFNRPYVVAGAAVAIVTGVGLLSTESKAQTPVTDSAIPEYLVNRLPLAYRDSARKVIRLPARLRAVLIDAYSEVSGDEWAGFAFGQMAKTPEGVDFLKAQLEREPSGGVRAQLIVALEPYFAQHSENQGVLERHVSTDPDPIAARTALETLRRISITKLGGLLDARMKAAEGSVAKELRDAYLSHYMWYGEARLPKFAYDPPPVFRAKASGQPIRVLSFGDFGWGSGNAQTKIATAMLAYHRKRPFDFGITLGDNFYGRGPFMFAEREGISSPYDLRWQTGWEQVYGPLGIKFYPSFGNADYFDIDGPAAEIAYTKRSQTWVFPAPYYTYTAGSVQFFAIDNIRLSDDELRWLDTELAKSRTRWKVVYGHYHIYSSTLGDNEELISRLLPVLKKNSVDVYLCGHLHEMEELQSDGGLHFFISGGGGAGLSYEPPPTYKRSTFRQARHGFSVLEADEQHLEAIFVNDEGQEVRRSRLTK